MLKIYLHIRSHVHILNLQELNCCVPQLSSTFEGTKCSPTAILCDQKIVCFEIYTILNFLVKKKWLTIFAKDLTPFWTTFLRNKNILWSYGIHWNTIIVYSRQSRRKMQGQYMTDVIYRIQSIARGSMGREGQNVVARLVSIAACFLFPGEINGKLLWSSIKKIQQIGTIVCWLVILIIFFVLTLDFKIEKLNSREKYTLTLKKNEKKKQQKKTSDCDPLLSLFPVSFSSHHWTVLHIGALM